MDAEQLWETTLNPETRILKRIEIEDGRMASDITELLMGNDVPPRKMFIYEHAKTQHLISDRDVGVTGTTGREQTVTCGREVSSAS